MNLKQPILCLYSRDKSDWISCKKIVPNLISSYKILRHKLNLKFLNYSRHENEFEFLQLAERILLLNPTKIIFVDHKPHPVHLLKFLLPRLSIETELVFHVYGDFILSHTNQMIALNENLKKFKIKFISASEKQKKYVDQFLKQPTISFTSPFPVNEKEFYLQNNKRSLWRKQLCINDESFVWLYAGRLSQQKNILELIETFAHYKMITKSDDKLLLLGHFDNIGFPYLCNYQKDFEYYYHFNKLLNSLPQNIKNDISHLGVFFGKELNELYNAADAFISLSTYHDEDYGMAIAEALCTGLPCVLSDWAGYSSFKNYVEKNQLEFIKIKLKSGQIEFDPNAVAGSMKKIKSKKFNRQKSALNAQQNLKISSVSQKLLNIISAKSYIFTGFSDSFFEVPKHFKSKSPFLGKTNKLNTYYEEIYEPYF